MDLDVLEEAVAEEEVEHSVEICFEFDSHADHVVDYHEAVANKN